MKIQFYPLNLKNLQKLWVYWTCLDELNYDGFGFVTKSGRDDGAFTYKIIAWKKFCPETAHASDVFCVFKWEINILLI